eukprot:13741355-Alexandrium_andersonii.AAC.1
MEDDDPFAPLMRELAERAATGLATLQAQHPTTGGGRRSTPGSPGAPPPPAPAPPPPPPRPPRGVKQEKAEAPAVTP